MFQPSSIVRLGNGTETPALLMLVAYLTSQICVMERTALIYLTKQIPARAFTNVNRFVLCVELRRFLTTPD